METGRKKPTDKDSAAKCAHAGCNCKARAGDKHCSDACRNEAATQKCTSGHPGSKIEEGVAP